MSNTWITGLMYIIDVYCTYVIFFPSNKADKSNVNAKYKEKRKPVLVKTINIIRPKILVYTLFTNTDWFNLQNYTVIHSANKKVVNVT